jgi:preprotein translocase subunit SecD
MRKFIGILGIGTSLISTFFVVAALVDLSQGRKKTENE